VPLTLRPDVHYTAHMRFTSAICGISLSCLFANAEQFELKATPKTVIWGNYSASNPPVLRIRSGDTVRIETVSTGSPKRFEAGGVPSKDIPQNMRDIFEQVKERGPGGHILTGPIYVEGAEPGDTLEVRIQAIEVTLPFAYNGFRPGSGFLPDDFPQARLKIVPLDRERMVARFSDSIEIPMRPFFGSMGVAPPEVNGSINSAPPWIHAGNLDNKELVAGTTLFIPIHAKGALFLAGDGHAGQGNGEVDITAMETSLIGTFQLIVRKDMHLRWPRAETPTHYITMGLHEDLNEATKAALREMIDFLVTQKHMTRDDAYMLSSVAADLDITQLVDGNKGVHAMIPKSIFVVAQEKTNVITMARGACFGTCPIYKITIASDGTVTFDGANFVKTRGTAAGTITRDDFNKLVTEFENLKFFSLDDEYVPGSKNCGPAATDLPYVTTSIQLNGKTKSVSHYQGCLNSTVVHSLFDLDRKIDQIAGTEKWIK
jgi:acetamidase/formamidase